MWLHTMLHNHFIKKHTHIHTHTRHTHMLMITLWAKPQINTSQTKARRIWFLHLSMANEICTHIHNSHRWISDMLRPRNPIHFTSWRSNKGRTKWRWYYIYVYALEVRHLWIGESNKSINQWVTCLVWKHLYRPVCGWGSMDAWLSSDAFRSVWRVGNKGEATPQDDDRRSVSVALSVSINCNYS